MLCCELSLPKPFGWRIKAIGDCTKLLDGLQNIMQLTQCSEEDAQLIVMPRSHFQTHYEDECSDWEIFYSRKAIRILNNDKLSQWLMVLPEHILSDHDLRIVLMWLMLKPFYRHCLMHGGLPVHASSAHMNQSGIIIASSGDTGKTTTVRRLPKPWLELADDVALLLPNGDEVNLYSLPTWSEFIHGRDKNATWDVKNGVKLSGIFFLEQSTEDHAERISVPLSMMSLYKSSMEAIGDVEEDISTNVKTNIFEIASNISAKVPSFLLRATLTGKVWESIESALCEI